jgi:urease accessory protein
VSGGEHKLPLYTIYPDESGKWRVQAVSVTPESFENRKGLPEAWRGLRDTELSQVTGVPDCVFVHASGFIGGWWHPISAYSVLMIRSGNATKDGALKMAKLALAM